MRQLKPYVDSTRIAPKRGALDVEMVQERHDVSHITVEVVRLGAPWLLTPTMPTMIEENAPIVRGKRFEVSRGTP
ncbi:MAG TPA: hypothetical protein VGR61_09225 [Candidatus Dormibacteraeota bacterium]|nr:hypothetical protein [Candidatus Dormibacteraeota bacterium]